MVTIINRERLVVGTATFLGGTKAPVHVMVEACHRSARDAIARDAAD